MITLIYEIHYNQYFFQRDKTNISSNLIEIQKDWKKKKKRNSFSLDKCKEKKR